MSGCEESLLRSNLSGTESLRLRSLQVASRLTRQGAVCGAPGATVADGAAGLASAEEAVEGGPLPVRHIIGVEEGHVGEHAAARDEQGEQQYVHRARLANEAHILCNAISQIAIY